MNKQTHSHSRIFFRAHIDGQLECLFKLVVSPFNGAHDFQLSGLPYIRIYSDIFSSSPRKNQIFIHPDFSPIIVKASKTVLIDSEILFSSFPMFHLEKVLATLFAFYTYSVNQLNSSMRINYFEPFFFLRDLQLRGEKWCSYSLSE